MTHRRWRVGLVLVALYAVVAVATHRLDLGAPRPLYDGFAPPPPYRWVKPPPALAAGNQPPQAADRTIPVTAQGSEAANASTTDAQVIVTLPQGALAAHDADTAVALKLTPLDPATLPALPNGLRSVSNAYQVGMAYQPSQAAVTQVAASAIVALTAASQGDTLLYSPDGRAWQTIASRPFGATNGLTGPLQGAGYYLVTASPSVTTTSTSVPGKGNSHGGPVALAIGGTIVVVAAGAAVNRMVKNRARRKRRRARDRRKNR